MAVISGLMLALSYAPYRLGYLGWVALIPLSAAVLLFPSPRRAGLTALGLGYTSGAVFFLISLSWLTTVTTPGWILLALYLAVYPALWALFLRLVAAPLQNQEQCWLKSSNNLRVALLAAAAWVTTEWLRSWVFSGFGWNSLAVTMIDNLPIIQMADLTGERGIAFLLVVVNLTLLLTIFRLKLEVGRRRMRPHFDFSLGIALVAIVFGYGAHILFSPLPEQKSVTYTAVQANIPIQEKLDRDSAAQILQVHERLSTPALIQSPDLLVWPEAATPGPLYLDRLSYESVDGIRRQLEGDFLLGSVHYEESGDFNAAILLGKAGTQIYRKVHLVPFGEFVPFRQHFPLFAWVVGDLVPDDFDFGPGPEVFELSRVEVKVAPLICFEDTLGFLVRQFATDGAQLLVTLTNDAWFLQSAGSEQHRDNALLRTVETRLPMLRVANTGVTCLIDPYGRELRRLEDNGNTFVEGVMSGEVAVPVAPPQTMFTQLGEWFTWLCIATTLIAMVVRARAVVRLRNA